eukprot:7388408-Prymnesium_polylepis.1
MAAPSRKGGMDGYFPANPDVPCADGPNTSRCCAQAHCNAHSGECISLPGAAGRACNEDSIFSLDRFRSVPRSWSSKFREQGMICSDVGKRIGYLRVFSKN